MLGKEGRARLRAVLIVGLLLVVFLTLSNWGISRKPPCPHVILPSGSWTPYASPLVWANPCPGNALTFAASNIVTLDLGDIGDDAIRLWQPDGSGSFDQTWFDEILQGYLDVVIGDPDGDGDRELVAFTYDTVRIKKLREYRAYFHVYEEGSTGIPDAQSAYFLLDRDPWRMKARIADVDGDGKSETIVVTANQLVIFEHDAQAGYVVSFKTQLANAEFRYGWDIGDPDADGQVELVTSTNQATLYVWDLQTDGTWSYVVSEPAPYPWLSAPRLGDVDGDGVQEIVDASGDMDKGESYVTVWRHGPQGYRIVTSQTILLGGAIHASGHDLGDVNGDGRDELAFGTVGGVAQDMAVLLSYDGASWTILWNAVTSAVTNHVWAGDADGDAGTLEFVFTGVHHAIKKGNKITSSLYIEVFRFDGSGLESTWAFSGDFLEAWSSHLG